MKKNYLKILIVAFLFYTSANVLRAQCSTPAPPAVSGGTIAGCVTSSDFTLTATPTGTDLIGWYADSFGGNALTTNSIFTTPTLTAGTTYYVGQSVQTSFDTLSLPTHSTILQSAQTRGYWFVAPNDFMITGLRVPTVVGGTLSAGLAVVKFPSNPPLYSSGSVANTFNTLYLNQNITGTNVVSVNIPVYTGDIIGVLGERGGDCSYGPTTNPFLATLGTSTINLNRLGMLHDLQTVLPSDLWTETTNSIGRVEMYTTGGCNSTLTPVSVSVVPVPNVVVAPPPFVCANSAYTLSASGANTYTWSGGPATSTYVVNPSTTTTYSVQGSILTNCTSSLSTVTISVDAGLPTLTVSSSSTAVCSGNTVVLSGSGAPSFTWAGGTNTVVNSTAFVPLATQLYTLYGSNSCGVSSAMITVTVNPTPTLITSSTPSAVCEGNTATLSVSGAATYSWDAAATAGTTVEVMPSVTTVYNVGGISSAGCSANAALVLIVHPNPTVTAGVLSSTMVCSGGSATLTSSGANAYSWDNGATTATNLVNPLSTQVYTVTGTNTVTQCFSSDTISIYVFTPMLSINRDTTVCNGAAITLTADAGSGSTYVWSTGAPFVSISITATASSSYSVLAQTTTSDGLTCNSSASVMITVVPNPTIQVVSTRTAICKGESAILTASGGTSYVWTNQTATTASIAVSPIAENIITNYTVTGIDANGCQNKATIGVMVNACTGISELEKASQLIAIYPNPNNGTFTVKADGDMQLSLINELGQIVKELRFTAENQFQQNVQDLVSGIYFITGIHNGNAIQKKLIVTK